MTRKIPARIVCGSRRTWRFLQHLRRRSSASARMSSITLALFFAVILLPLELEFKRHGVAVLLDHAGALATNINPAAPDAAAALGAAQGALALAEHHFAHLDAATVTVRCLHLLSATCATPGTQVSVFCPSQCAGA